MTTRPLLVHFGAGNIGRALVGSLFSQAGWEIVFVDAAPPLIKALNARGSYPVRVKGPLTHGATRETTLVEHVRGLMAQDTDAVAEAVARADLVGTAVGGGVLPRLFPVLARGIQMRNTPLSILMCENLHGARAIAREGLRRELPEGFPLDERVGLVETSIGKMVPIMPAPVRERDPLEVWGEAYNQIIADRDGFIGEPPAVPGLVCKPRFEAYVDRKLYIHNFGHAVAAYRGHLAGKTFLWECMEDAAVRGRVAEAMMSTAGALVHRYPDVFTVEAQREHVEDLLDRFGNRELGDTVFRVGRDLPRKLAPGDRLIGSLRLIEEEGQDPRPVHEVIACACRFRAVDETGAPFEADAAFLQRIEEEGLRAVLVNHCGLNPERDAAHLDGILAAYGE